MAHSPIEDLAITSQNGESSMNAGPTSNIRNAEPMEMFENTANSQFNKSQRLKTAALACESSVPPRIEAATGGSISKGKLYKSAEPAPVTQKIQWQVRSGSGGRVGAALPRPTTGWHASTRARKERERERGK
jgi:hypothetical protein